MNLERRAVKGADFFPRRQFNIDAHVQSSNKRGGKIEPVIGPVVFFKARKRGLFNARALSKFFLRKSLSLARGAHLFAERFALLVWSPDPMCERRSAAEQMRFHAQNFATVRGLIQ